MKCVCHDIDFGEIKQKICDLKLKSIHECLKHINFGKKCKLCVPYIEKILEENVNGNSK
jgi:bacterioferritin-associated ferredoxin